MKKSCQGRLAQLVRAPALQAGGPRFEPATAHHSTQTPAATLHVRPNSYAKNKSFHETWLGNIPWCRFVEDDAGGLQGLAEVIAAKPGPAT